MGGRCQLNNKNQMPPHRGGTFTGKEGVFMLMNDFLSKTPGELKEDRAKRKADRAKRREVQGAAKQSYKDERQTERPRRKKKPDGSDDLDGLSEEALLAALDETEADYFDGDSESAREAAAADGFPVTKSSRFNIKISRTKDGVPIAPFGWMIGYRRPADEEYISLSELVKLLPHPDDRSSWPEDKAVFSVTIDEEGKLYVERFPTRYEDVFLEAWAPIEDAYVAAYAAYVNGQAVKTTRGKSKDKPKRLKFDNMSKDEIELVLLHSGYTTAAELASLGSKKLYKVYQQAIDKARAEGQKKAKAKKAKKGQTESEPTASPTGSTESTESAEPATQPQSEEGEESAAGLKTLTAEEVAVLEEEEPLLTDQEDIQYINARLDKIGLDADLKLDGFSQEQTGMLYQAILCLRDKGKNVAVTQVENMIDTIFDKG